MVSHLAVLVVCLSPLALVMCACPLVMPLWMRLALARFSCPLALWRALGRLVMCPSAPVAVRLATLATSSCLVVTVAVCLPLMSLALFACLRVPPLALRLVAQCLCLLATVWLALAVPCRCCLVLARMARRALSVAMSLLALLVLMLVCLASCLCPPALCSLVCPAPSRCPLVPPRLALVVM